MHAVKLKLFFFWTRFCEQKEETIACSRDVSSQLQLLGKKHSHSQFRLVCKAINQNLINDVFFSDSLLMI